MLFKIPGFIISIIGFGFGLMGIFWMFQEGSIEETKVQFLIFDGLLILGGILIILFGIALILFDSKK
jgi:TRAP-type mannitol/chloroaromatic compound transport system permease small subunit